MEEGKSVFLLGFTSLHESAEVALSNINNAAANSEQMGNAAQKEVLFVVRIWNVSSYPGFKIN